MNPKEFMQGVSLLKPEDVLQKASLNSQFEEYEATFSNEEFATGASIRLSIDAHGRMKVSIPVSGNGPSGWSIQYFPPILAEPDKQGALCLAIGQFKAVLAGWIERHNLCPLEMVAGMMPDFITIFGDLANYEPEHSQVSEAVVNALLNGDADEFMKEFRQKHALLPGTFFVVKDRETWEVDFSGKIIQEFIGSNARPEELHDISRFDIEELIHRIGRYPRDREEVNLSNIGYYGPSGEDLHPPTAPLAS